MIQWGIWKGYLAQSLGLCPISEQFGRVLHKERNSVIKSCPLTNIYFENILLWIRAQTGYPRTLVIPVVILYPPMNTAPPKFTMWLSFLAQSLNLCCRKFFSTLNEENVQIKILDCILKEWFLKLPKSSFSLLTLPNILYILTLRKPNLTFQNASLDLMSDFR